MHSSEAIMYPHTAAMYYLPIAYSSWNSNNNNDNNNNNVAQVLETFSGLK